MNRLSLIRYTSAVALGLSTLWSAAVCAAEDAGAFDKIQQIRAGDLNIGYVDIGPRDGQPVILLHGWPYDIQSYAQVAPALAQKGYRVIVPYLRGYGTTRFLSASTPRNGQPSAMAADIVHLMDALNIRQADRLWRLAARHCRSPFAGRQRRHRRPQRGGVSAAAGVSRPSPAGAEPRSAAQSDPGTRRGTV